ncbi:MAG: ubiquinol-cytochrome c reductase iron-sulfur subunit, partial [Thermoanaerobaculia bacterium]
GQNGALSLVYGGCMAVPELTRRGFDLFLLVTMPLIYGAGIIAAVARYLIPSPRGPRLERLDVGAAEEFASGAVRKVEFNGRQVFVLQDGKELRAFDSTCTHLSCRVEWQPAARKFRCHCHGGMFEPSGAVCGGPPKKPLARQAVMVTPEGRVVLLDRPEGA